MTARYADLCAWCGDLPGIMTGTLHGVDGVALCEYCIGDPHTHFPCDACADTCRDLQDPAHRQGYAPCTSCGFVVGPMGSLDAMGDPTAATVSWWIAELETESGFVASLAFNTHVEAAAALGARAVNGEPVTARTLRWRG